MPYRIEKVNKLIRREISELLQREVKDPRLGNFVSIIQVSTSADLRYAKVFVSFVGDTEDKQDILNVLTSASGFLRKELARRIKIRRIPELIFIWDDSIEKGTHLLKIIEQVNVNDTPPMPTD